MGELFCDVRAAERAKPHPRNYRQRCAAVGRSAVPHAHTSTLVLRHPTVPASLCCGVVVRLGAVHALVRRQRRSYIEDESDSDVVHSRRERLPCCVRGARVQRPRVPGRLRYFAMDAMDNMLCHMRSWNHAQGADGWRQRCFRWAVLPGW